MGLRSKNDKSIDDFVSVTTLSHSELFK